jgi:hypothetical protein
MYLTGNFGLLQKAAVGRPRLKVRRFSKISFILIALVRAIDKIPRHL